MPRQIRDRTNKVPAMTFLFVCVQYGDADDCPSYITRVLTAPLEATLPYGTYQSLPWWHLCGNYDIPKIIYYIVFFILTPENLEAQARSRNMFLCSGTVRTYL